MRKKPELLAPAGDLEKLKAAVVYGADAVYVGGKGYGLRASAGSFGIEEMKEGIAFAHERGAKLYVALNIFAHNSDLNGFAEYVAKLHRLGADAFIVSDQGLFGIIRKTLPDANIHISTQANVTNYASANFWYEMGARRIVLSRELTLAEITEIRRSTPDDLVLECFVHGAMCLSYSGRCYLSQYLNSRDANRGGCSQPCRWSYALMEEKREGEYFPVFEDDRGAYILNSKDLRMVAHIPELLSAGVGSFKIEGRMKSAYYAASTVKAYRSAIDDYFKSPEKYRKNIRTYLEETEKTSHRKYYTGFYFNGADGVRENGQSSDSSMYIRGYEYVALVLDYDEKTQTATVSQRNKFSVGEELEVLREGGSFTFTLSEMYDENGEAAPSAPHPCQILKIKAPKGLCEYNILRRAQR